MHADTLMNLVTGLKVWRHNYINDHKFKAAFPLAKLERIKKKAMHNKAWQKNGRDTAVPLRDSRGRGQIQTLKRASWSPTSPGSSCSALTQPPYFTVVPNI